MGHTQGHVALCHFYASACRPVCEETFCTRSKSRNKGVAVRRCRRGAASAWGDKKRGEDSRGIRPVRVSVRVNVSPMCKKAGRVVRALHHPLPSLRSTPCRPTKSVRPSLWEELVRVRFAAGPSRATASGNMLDFYDVMSRMPRATAHSLFSPRLIPPAVARGHSWQAAHKTQHAFTPLPHAFLPPPFMPSLVHPRRVPSRLLPSFVRAAGSTVTARRTGFQRSRCFGHPSLSAYAEYVHPRRPLRMPLAHTAHIGK